MGGPESARNHCGVLQEGEDVESWKLGRQGTGAELALGREAGGREVAHKLEQSTQKRSLQALSTGGLNGEAEPGSWGTTPRPQVRNADEGITKPVPDPETA